MNAHSLTASESFHNYGCIPAHLLSNRLRSVQCAVQRYPFLLDVQVCKLPWTLAQWLYRFNRVRVPNTGANNISVASSYITIFQTTKDIHLDLISIMAVLDISYIFAANRMLIGQTPKRARIMEPALPR